MMALACSAAPSAAAANKSTLKIGLIGPFSGPTATLGKILEGPCAGGVALVNHDGGVLGHKLTCSPVDDLGDPADAVANVSKALATTSNIVGVIGTTTATASTVVPIVNSANLTLVAANGLSEFTKKLYPYFWRMTSPDLFAGVGMGLEAVQEHFKKVAVLIQNSTANTGTRPGIIAALKAHHVKVVSNLVIPGDATSYESIVNRMRTKKPQGLIISADLSTTGTLLSEYKSLNNGKVPPSIIPTALIGPSLFQTLGQKLMGLKYFTKTVKLVGTYVDTKSPAFKQYAKAVRSTSIGATEASAILSTQAVASLYDGVIVESLAMTAAHSTNPKIYNKYMRKVTAKHKGAVTVHTYKQGIKKLKHGKRIRYVGVSGPISFDKFHTSYGEFAAFTYNHKGLVKTGAIIKPKEVKAIGNSVK